MPKESFKTVKDTTVAMDKLLAIFPQSADKYVTKNLELQEPSITIDGMQTVAVGSAKEYFELADMRGNISLEDVRGYTNVMPGTKLTFYLDESRQVKPKAYYANATGDNLGEMRQYQVYIPLYWNDLAPGMHTISGYTPLGGKVFADFYVNIMPNDSFVPDNTVKWVGDRNPYVPPVTVTIPVEVPGPTQTIIVTITPDQDQLNRTAYEQQKIVAAENDKKFWDSVWYWSGVATVIGALIAGIILGRPYVKDVMRRAKR